MKKAYIIRTSEDGNLGIYTNKKKVYECIKKLMLDGWEDLTLYIDRNNKPEPTYQNISKELKKYSFATLHSKDKCIIDIEMFYVNRL